MRLLHWDKPIAIRQADQFPRVVWSFYGLRLGHLFIGITPKASVGSAVTAHCLRITLFYATSSFRTVATVVNVLNTTLTQ